MHTKTSVSPIHISRAIVAPHREVYLAQESIDSYRPIFEVVHRQAQDNRSSGCQLPCILAMIQGYSRKQPL